MINTQNFKLEVGKIYIYKHKNWIVKCVEIDIPYVKFVCIIGPYTVYWNNIAFIPDDKYEEL